MSRGIDGGRARVRARARATVDAYYLTRGPVIKGIQYQIQ